MKQKNLLFCIILCALTSSLLFSCKKSHLSIESIPQTTINYKSSGALEDKPSLISKVSMVMSSSFLKQTNNPDLIQSFNTKTFPGKGKGNDHIAPTVSITSPANASSVSGTVIINVSAADNIGVNKVDLTVDNVLMGSLTSSPYNFAWNSAGAISGTHSITATASDAAGNKASYTITVTLNTVVNITPVPSAFPVSFKLHMPPVGNQGSEGSCAAFAVAYAGRGYEQYYKTGATSYSYATNIFSPEYVYNQTKFGEDCLSGTTVGTVLNFLQTNGVPTWQTMPYSGSNGCSLMPNNSQTAEAANYKISSYIKLANTDMPAIKTRLINNHPVIIRVVIDNAFYNLQPGSIWSNSAGTTSTGHALTICGYDDNRKAYLAVNSWGTGWGDAGYCWIDYNFFTSVSSYYVYSIN